MFLIKIMKIWVFVIFWQLGRSWGRPAPRAFSANTCDKTHCVSLWKLLFEAPPSHKIFRLLRRRSNIALVCPWTTASWAVICLTQPLEKHETHFYQNCPMFYSNMLAQLRAMAPSCPVSYSVLGPHCLTLWRRPKIMKWVFLVFLRK